MSRAHNQILLQKWGEIPYREGEIGQTGCYPGMCMKVQSNGKYHRYTGATGAVDPVLVLREEAFVGRTTDTAFESGERARMWEPRSGDIVNVLLKDGQVVDVGDHLVHETLSGLFIKAAGTEAQVDFEVQEALDLSAAGANALVAAKRL